MSWALQGVLPSHAPGRLSQPTTARSSHTYLKNATHRPRLQNKVQAAAHQVGDGTIHRGVEGRDHCGTQEAWAAAAPAE